MVANAFIIMLGGSETSSTALAAATYFLTLCPATLAKLTTEIFSAFETESEINVHNIQNLPYLTAVMDETLRIHPPLPQSSPRVVHQGGDVICGTFVPEGVSTALSASTMAFRTCLISSHRPLSRFLIGQCIGAPRTLHFPTPLFRSAGWASLDLPTTGGKLGSLSRLVQGTVSG